VSHTSTREIRDEMSEKVREHYIGVLGLPSATHYETGAGHQFAICTWENCDAADGLCVYATIGAFDTHSEDSSRTHMQEYILVLSSRHRHVERSIFQFIIECTRRKIVPRFGTIYSLHDSLRLWENTDMRSYLVLSGQDLVPDWINGSNHVLFHKLYGLFDEEIVHIKQCSLASLLDWWEDLDTPVENPLRSTARLPYCR